MIDGPVGVLEAVVEEPPLAVGVAVICHPHPQFGGTLHNKVVHTLARSARAAGWIAVRFNYRGVGSSAGSYDQGRGEVEDALAVVAWARTRWPGLGCALGGFSFGGMVALAAAARVQPTWLVTVAPAVEREEFATVAANAVRAGPPSLRWLIVQGDADDLVSAPAVARFAAAFEPAPQLRLLEGVGHFFHGRLHDLGEVVTTFLGPAP